MQSLYLLFRPLLQHFLLVAGILIVATHAVHGQQQALTPRVVVAHFPSSVDSLQSTQDVERWILNNAKSYGGRNYFYPDFQVDTALVTYEADCQGICAALPVKPWTKLDLDGNGYTDLLVYRDQRFFNQYERQTYIFFNYGAGHVRVEHLLGRGASRCEVAAAVQIEGRPALVYYHTVTPPLSSGFNLNEEPVPQLDTLVFRFGDLVEYNARPVTPQFQRLKLQVGEDNYTTYSITIQPDRNILFELNDSFWGFPKREITETGIFTNKLDSAYFEQIQALFRYIKPEQLVASYAVNWTDAGTIRLTVDYGNGKVLQVKDYGERATWGLKRLYELVANLSTEVRWYSVDHPYDVPTR